MLRKSFHLLARVKRRFSGVELCGYFKCLSRQLALVFSIDIFQSQAFIDIFNAMINLDFSPLVRKN